MFKKRINNSESYCSQESVFCKQTLYLVNYYCTRFSLCVCNLFIWKLQNFGNMFSKLVENFIASKTFPPILPYCFCYTLVTPNKIMEPSSLPIRIPLGPKYSPQVPVLKTVRLHSSLNIRDHVSHP